MLIKLKLVLKVALLVGDPLFALKTMLRFVSVAPSSSFSSSFSSSPSPPPSRQLLELQLLLSCLSYVFCPLGSRRAAPETFNFP